MDSRTLRRTSKRVASTLEELSNKITNMADREDREPA
jgi:hypothetical protein